MEPHRPQADSDQHGCFDDRLPRALRTVGSDDEQRHSEADEDRDGVASAQRDLQRLPWLARTGWVAPVPPRWERLPATRMRGRCCRPWHVKRGRRARQGTQLMCCHRCSAVESVTLRQPGCPGRPSVCSAVRRRRRRKRTTYHRGQAKISQRLFARRHRSPAPGWGAPLSDGTSAATGNVGGVVHHLAVRPGFHSGMAERVRVREISNDEGGRLLKTVRRSSGSIVTWRRAQIVLWSAQGMDVGQIAPLAFTSEDRVRAVIHNFNADGFDSLYPRYAGGRPPTFTPSQRRQIKQIALARPTRSRSAVLDVVADQAGRASRR